jgi:tRNA (cmo5U34)-methyltransferase
METDKIFKEQRLKSTDFRFDANVVKVFDDMVVRSVPFYLEIQRMITEIASDYVQPDTSLYDLGCSTGTTLLSLNISLDPSVRFVGIDESEEMREKCCKNLEVAGITRSFDLLGADLNKQVEIHNASVVIMCLTLQFVRPINRLKLLQSVYNQINPGGCLILVEKVLGEECEFNRQFIKNYYNFKRRNNYDELEIAQKREALENVLIPYKLSEDIQLLKDAGFNSTETFFKWYNFVGIVALKNS